MFRDKGLLERNSEIRPAMKRAPFVNEPIMSCPFERPTCNVKQVLLRPYEYARRAFDRIQPNARFDGLRAAVKITDTTTRVRYVLRTRVIITII